ncbi:MAG: tRNA (adenosine(37)-N6)-threonylcarbamoyltransferase complex ATPase subunit type 1 TsaE [Ramlibacter sp.]|nr:tRNA (adenosine(37)-N6)-threonylcarbamoyltransferase complex ATPase subunit type 1 TsaE [Ramlibacter sp.]
MEPASQPGAQTGLGRGQIHTGHADLGKSQRTGPCPDVFHQTRTVDLTAAERHAPIVETMPTRVLAWPAEDDTRAFAQRLAGSPAVRNAFIELHGDLGAGKTTLVRHLLRALGVQGRVKSPTYAVVEPHEAPGLAIWHFDFYRFTDPREWEDAGFRDVFASPGLKLAEWPQNAAPVLPVADLVIRIQAGPNDARTATLTAQTATGRTLLEDATA